MSRHGCLVWIWTRTRPFSWGTAQALATLRPRGLPAEDGIRPNQSLDALGKLRPYFDRPAGTVIAGDSCPVIDGAIAVVLVSEQKANELGIEPLGWVMDWL